MIASKIHRSPESLDSITPLILTYNEEHNISRTLTALRWARRILVIDSHSTDMTLDILAKFDNVEVLQRKFDTHAAQWNYGLSQISNGWILSLDADYLINADLLDEIAIAISTNSNNAISGYRAPFRYCVAGKPLRGTVLPPRIILFHKSAGIYQDDGHTQQLHLNGLCADLHHPIFHDDRKPLSRWLWAQKRYIDLEAAKLIATPKKQLSIADRMRNRYIFAPFAMLIVCLIWHRGLLDGWRGWFYAFQRLYAETLLSLTLWETRNMR